MTDQEIIKALECCANELGCVKCPVNPHRWNFGYCTTPLIKSALDLITRQRAEIERLKRLLEDEERSTNLLAKKCYKDGIKEFAERLTELAYEGYSGRALPEYVFVNVEQIKNLVKEMGRG